MRRANGEAAQHQPRSCRGGGGMRRDGPHRAADHHGGQLVPCRLSRDDGGDEAPLAQHADTVRAHHLIHLVGDEDDRNAGDLEIGEEREEAVGLLRRQHGGRLIEDQKPGTEIERLDDLHPLHLAYREA